MVILTFFKHFPATMFIKIATTCRFTEKKIIYIFIYIYIYRIAFFVCDFYAQVIPGIINETKDFPTARNCSDTINLKTEGCVLKMQNI